MINEEEIIKSKLKDFRPKFEAADWAAMEKMLDEKKDKKPIVIWWKYGLAVGLFIFASVAGISTYSLLNHHNSKNNITHTVNNHQTTKSTNHNSPKNTASTGLHPNNSINITSNAPILKQQKSNHSINNNAIFKTNTVNPSNQKTQYISKSNATIAKSIEKRNVDVTKQNQLFISENAISSVNKIFTKQELVSINKYEISKLNELINELTLKNTEKEFANTNKRNKHNLPDLNYSLSLQGSGLINFSLNKYKVNLYLDQFSDANIIGQMMIGKFIGFYVGIGYADRKAVDSFDLNKFNDIVYSDIKIVKNKLIGLNIPVGITTNIYKQAYFNIYAKAGVNNIIFLNQKTIAEYTNNPTYYIQPDNITKLGNTIINSSADLYTTSAEVYDISNSSIPSSNNTSSATYKGKPKEKYLAEMQLALGVKINMTKNLGFIFEPAYSIGFKNKYRPSNTHNIAVSGAFVYSF